ncbi:MAG: hypothetical protein Q9167_002032 [Letrouitia subvulpina]
MDPEPASMLLGGILALSLREFAVKALKVITSTTGTLKIGRMANQILYGKDSSFSLPVTKTIPLMPTSTTTATSSSDSFQPFPFSETITIIFVLIFIMTLSATLTFICFVSRHNTQTHDRAKSLLKNRNTASTSLLTSKIAKRDRLAKDILITKLKFMIVELENQTLHQSSRILELHHRLIDETSTRQSLTAKLDERIIELESLTKDQGALIVELQDETSAGAALAAKLQNRIDELESQAIEQNAESFELQQNLMDQASAGLTLVTELQTKILDLESKAEEQSSSCRNLTLSAFPVSSISIEPGYVHPRKLRNTMRGGPNKGRHAQKPDQADEIEQTAEEEAEDGKGEKGNEVEAEGETGDLARNDNEKPKGQGRPGHRARHRQKKREQKAAEEAALRSSTTHQT